MRRGQREHVIGFEQPLEGVIDAGTDTCCVMERLGAEREHARFHGQAAAHSVHSQPGCRHRCARDRPA